MTTETRAAFLAAILDNPADDTHRGAYADALRESDDPFDRLHGRFISAGLTLHHTREPEENNEGVFYSAIEEQNATAPAVLAAQIKHLFGWEWGPDLAWTNDSAAPGRVTLRLLPPRSEVPLTVRERRERRRQPRPQPGVVWERGCVAGVRIGFEHWTERAPQLLTLCPIEWAEPLEAPGLRLLVLRADDGAGWRLGASLELPAVPQRLRPADEPGGLETIVPAQPAATVFHVFPGHTSGLSRHQLLVDFRWATRNLIEGVQARVGDRWPGTRSTK